VTHARLQSRGGDVTRCEGLYGRRHGGRRLAKRASTTAPAAPDMVPADYGAAAEFIGRNDPHNPALAVKNGDGRYWLVRDSEV
jgi:hypothetical protein